MIHDFINDEGKKNKTFSVKLSDEGYDIIKAVVQFRQERGIEETANSFITKCLQFVINRFYDDDIEITTPSIMEVKQILSQKNTQENGTAPITEGDA